MPVAHAYSKAQYPTEQAVMIIAWFQEVLAQVAKLLFS
jgi:hypothetical protein